MIPIAELRQPGLRELYGVYTARALPCPEHRRAEFDTLVDGFRHGWHELGWYLYWLATTQGLPVLQQYNRIFSPRTVTAFNTIGYDNAIAYYEETVAGKWAHLSCGTPPLLRYVLYLQRDPCQAPNYLEQNLLCILCAYLGMPMVRTVLEPETETRLWTRAVSLCACSTRP